MVTTEQIEQTFNDSYEALLDAYETSYKPIVKEKVTKYLNDSDTQRLWQSNVITDPNFVSFYMDYYRSLLKDAVCDEELFRNLFNIDGDIDDLTEEEKETALKDMQNFTAHPDEWANDWVDNQEDFITLCLSENDSSERFDILSAYQNERK